jgi:phenylpropionate dioxygenase-like ring-hydroxylating dioxygenase large terminal subunit
LYGALGPLIHFAIYSDHSIIFNVKPTTVDETEIQILWLVDDSNDLTEEQVELITWLWETTIQQDIKLTENVQRQMKSDYFTGGYYVDMEEHSQQFKDWYLQQISNLSKAAPG